MSTFPERLLQRVNEHCAENNTTVEALAEDLGLGRSRFRHYWERGSRPPHDMMLKIADKLEMDLNWVFGRDVSPEWPKKDPLETISARLTAMEKKIQG